VAVSFSAGGGVFSGGDIFFPLFHPMAEIEGFGSED
jgi:hypothetical protein